VALVHLIGQKPAKPIFKIPLIILPESLTELENQIKNSQKEAKGIKHDNEARIVWADSSKKEKTIKV
jgi:hypothetical protein